MNLSDAITAVENAQSSYQAAVVTTTNDQTTAQAMQAKADTAAALVTTDQQAQTAAAVQYNATLAGLVEAATAAMIPMP